MVRRDVLGLVPVISVALLSSASAEVGAGSTHTFRVPAFEFLYESDITLADAQEFGSTIEGTRRIIPITGGHFQGPRLRGVVISGGADWNLSRSDGGSSVDADYYLRTDDGVTLRIVNKGVGEGSSSEDPVTGERFLMYTTPSIEAPRGKYDWLNRTSLVGTLSVRRNAKNTVLIRVFKLI